MMKWLDQEVADIIRELVELYDSGKLDGLMVVAKVGDEVQHSYGGMSFLERLGAIQVMQIDTHYQAVQHEEEE
jgi:hypothetical protein